jgi:hypothetical protein
MVHEMAGTAVKRVAVEQQIAGLQKLHHSGGDRRHTAFEGGAGFCFVPERQAVFQNFHVRIIQSAVNQACFFACFAFPQAVRELEKALPSSANQEAEPSDFLQTKQEARHEGNNATQKRITKINY